MARRDLMLLLAAQGTAGTPAPASAPTITTPASDYTEGVTYAVGLEWSAVDGAQWYEIEYRNTLTGVPTVSLVVDTTYTLPATTNQTVWKARVRAANLTGAGPWSSVRTITFLVNLLKISFATDASSPVASYTGEIGTLTGSGATSRASVATDKMTIATSGLTVNYTTDGFARVPGRGLYFKIANRTSQPFFGWHHLNSGTPAAYNQIDYGFNTSNNFVTSDDENTINTSYSSFAGTESWIVLQDEGADFFVYNTNSNEWQHVYHFLTHADATMYLRLGAPSGSGCDFDDVIVRDLPLLAGADWYKRRDTDPQLGVLYNGAVDGTLKIRANVGTIAGGYCYIYYHYQDSDNWRRVGFTGADFVLQERKAGGSITDLLTPSSTAGADGGSYDIMAHFVGNTNSGLLHNRTTDAVTVELTRAFTTGLTSVQTFMIDASAEWAIDLVDMIATIDPFYAQALGSTPPAEQSLPGLLNTASIQNIMTLKSDPSKLYINYASSAWRDTLKIIDMSAGTAKTLYNQQGRIAQGNVNEHANGKIYLASDEPNEVWEYNPSTDAWAKVFYTAPGIRACGGGLVECSHSSGGAYNDGTMFFGGVTKARFSYYKPADGTSGYYDSIFPSRGYVYFIAADPTGQYIYMCLSYQPWILVVFDRSDSSQTAYFDDQNDLDGTGLYTDDATGDVYYARNIAGSYTWYEFVSGVPSALGSAPSGVTAARQQDNGFEYDEGLWDYEVDLDNATVTAINSPTVRFRELPSGAWSTLDIEGVTTDPVSPGVLVPYNASEFFVIPNEYQPAYFVNPATYAMRLAGKSGSMYCAVVDGSGNILFCGYFDEVLYYLTGSAWTRTASSGKTGVNPNQLFSSAGAKTLYAIELPDNSKWAWTEEVRGNASNGSFLHTISSDYTTFQHYGKGKAGGDPFDLEGNFPSGMRVLGNGYVVLSIDDSVEGRIVVADPSDMSVVATYNPPDSAADPGSIVAVFGTEVVFAQDFRIYRIDTADGSVVFNVSTGTDKVTGSHSYSYQRDRGCIYAVSGTDWIALMDDTMEVIDLTDGSRASLSNPAGIGYVSYLGSTAYVYSKLIGIIPAQTA